MLFRVLVLTMMVEVGFLSGGSFNYSERSDDWKDIGALYTSMEAMVRGGPVFVEGSMMSYFVPDTLVNYVPTQMTFVIGGGVKLGDVTIGYRHSCFHPMEPYRLVVGDEVKPTFEGGMHQFYGRVELK